MKFVNFLHEGAVRTGLWAPMASSISQPLDLVIASLLFSGKCDRSFVTKQFGLSSDVTADSSWSVAAQGELLSGSGIMQLPMCDQTAGENAHRIVQRATAEATIHHA